MPGVRPLPRTGAIFTDARGADRALRLTWHDDQGLVVVSLWRENTCTASFRLAVDEVPALIEVLRAGLDDAYATALSQHVHRLRGQRAG